MTVGQLSDHFQKSLQDASSLSIDMTALSFVALIKQTAMKRCTNPRDKIYAMLGLMKAGLAERIRPQYSLEISEVFKSACVANLEESDRLDVMESCYLEHREMDGPSWVPDLTMGLEGTAASWALSRQFASGYSLSHATYQDPDSLIVHGKLCGTVSNVSGSIEPETFSLHVVRDILSLWLSSIKGAAFIHEQTILEQIIRTLCRHHCIEHYKGVEGLTLKQWRRYFYPESFDEPGETPEQLRVLVNSRSRHNAHLRSFWRRCFFLTDSNIVGLGPPGSKKGMSSKKCSSIQPVQANVNNRRCCVCDTWNGITSFVASTR